MRRTFLSETHMRNFDVDTDHRAYIERIRKKLSQGLRQISRDLFDLKLRP